jgi:hypothetical protein
MSISRHWTPQEDNKIKAADREDFPELAALFDRSVAAVKKRFRKLMPTHTKFSLWTKEEDEYLLANKGNMTAREIGLKLNRAVGGVENRVGVLRRKSEAKKPAFNWQLNKTYSMKKRKPPIGVFIEFHGFEGDYKRLSHGQWRLKTDSKTDAYFHTALLSKKANEYSLLEMPSVGSET